MIADRFGTYASTAGSNGAPRVWLGRFTRVEKPGFAEGLAGLSKQTRHNFITVMGCISTTPMGMRRGCTASSVVTAPVGRTDAEPNACLASRSACGPAGVLRCRCHLSLKERNETIYIKQVRMDPSYLWNSCNPQCC